MLLVLKLALLAHKAYLKHIRQIPPNSSSTFQSVFRRTPSTIKQIADARIQEKHRTDKVSTKAYINDAGEYKGFFPDGKIEKSAEKPEDFEATDSCPRAACGARESVWQWSGLRCSCN